MAVSRQNSQTSQYRERLKSNVFNRRLETGRAAVTSMSPSSDRRLQSEDVTV